MADLLFRSPMNVSSETFAYPINHHRRVITNKHSSMFVRASPIAVNNKIRAIQTRKPRISLQSYSEFTDIRPLNIAHPGGLINSSGTFSNISPEKLVERSKELRLARQNERPSVLSTTSTTNQQSLIWASYNSPTGFAKQPSINSPANSPTAPGPTMNKSSSGPMPDIPQRSSRAQTITRQPLTEQQNLLVPIDSRHRSLPKRKSSVPKAYNQMMSKNKSSYPLSNTQRLQISHPEYFKQLNNDDIIHLYESEEDIENVLIMDEEFQKYLKKAIVKCADWLIRYVFDKTYDEDDE